MLMVTKQAKKEVSPLQYGINSYAESALPW